MLRQDVLQIDVIVGEVALGVQHGGDDGKAVLIAMFQHDEARLPLVAHRLETIAEKFGVAHHVYGGHTCFGKSSTPASEPMMHVLASQAASMGLRAAFIPQECISELGATLDRCGSYPRARASTRTSLSPLSEHREDTPRQRVSTVAYSKSETDIAPRQ